MSKLKGWSPKQRSHRVVNPRYSDEELNEPLEIISFDDAYIERDETLTTRGKLVERFYRLNNFENECNAWYKMILDPEKYTAPKQHFWVIIHSGDYLVFIDINLRGAQQVHRVRLMYKQDSGRWLWLASAQIGPVYFYSQAAVASEYIRVLQRKEFYISPKQATKIVAM